MARYDKYDPKSGGCRAKLNADMAKTSDGNPVAVGLNSSGRVVAGAGNTGIIGVLVLTKDMKAGDTVDVMRSGEIVEMESVTAGTIITADTTSGAVGTTAASATKVAIGHTVEATRLVVNVKTPGFDATGA